MNISGYRKCFFLPRLAAVCNPALSTKRDFCGNGGQLRSLFQFQLILFRVEIDHFAVGVDFGHFAEGRHFELIATVKVTAFAAPADISDCAVFKFFGLPLLALEFQNTVLFVETENAFATNAVECDYGSATDAVNVFIFNKIGQQK